MLLSAFTKHMSLSPEVDTHRTPVSLELGGRNRTHTEMEVGCDASAMFD